MAKRVIVLERSDPGRWQLLYWLTVPVTRQAFYAKPGAVSRWIGASAGESAAIASGAVREVGESFSAEGAPSLAEVQAAVEARWQVLQNETDAANPWLRFGSYWDGTSWTLGGVS